MSLPTESHMSAAESTPTTINKEKSEHRKKGKLFGRYHEIVLLALGFILTTVLGAFIGAGIQRQESERLRSLAMEQAKQLWLREQAQAELDKASTVHEKLATLMDSRRLRMEQLVDAYKSKHTTSQTLERLREAYRSVFKEWNENLNLNVTLVNQYFGEEMRGQFEGIMREFSSINDLINNLMRKEDKHASSLNKRIDRLEHTIFLFNQKMSKNLQGRKAAINN